MRGKETNKEKEEAADEEKEEEEEDKCRLRLTVRREAESLAGTKPASRAKTRCRLRT